MLLILKSTVTALNLLFVVTLWNVEGRKISEK